MARYYYIVSGGPEHLWVGEDGNFGTLGDDEKPTDYNAFTSFKKAKDVRINSLLKNNYECVIYQFEAKAPYKFIGVAG